MSSNGHTDPTTVTLAAHARRGLMKSTKVQTLGELRMCGTPKIDGLGY